MTWQGGKRPPEVSVAPPFAPLRQLVKEPQQDFGHTFQNLAEALRDFDAPVRLHIRLLNDSEDDHVEHWDVQGGTAPSARREEPKKADVLLVVRRGTWMEIVQGRLSPFDALFAGRLRVGGNLETAKRLTKHLSDPSVPYVPPC
jgi:SCP-2 sterol transfer family